MIVKHPPLIHSVDRYRARVMIVLTGDDKFHGNVLDCIWCCCFQCCQGLRGPLVQANKGLTFGFLTCILAVYMFVMNKMYE